MIDVHLLVYAGTLAVFLICALAVGVLCVVVFTALATLSGIARARRRSRTQYEETDAWDPEDLLPNGAFTEVGDQIRPPAEEHPPGPGNDLPVGPAAILRRPGQPRLIQHT